MSPGRASRPCGRRSCGTSTRFLPDTPHRSLPSPRCSPRSVRAWPGHCTPWPPPCRWDAYTSGVTTSPTSWPAPSSAHSSPCTWYGATHSRAVCRPPCRPAELGGPIWPPPDARQRPGRAVALLDCAIRSRALSRAPRSAGASLQHANAAGRAVQLDAIAVVQPSSRVANVHDRGQSVLAGQDGGVGQEAAHLGHDATHEREDGRERRLDRREHDDVAGQITDLLPRPQHLDGAPHDARAHAEAAQIAVRLLGLLGRLDRFVTTQQVRRWWL